MERRKTRAKYLWRLGWRKKRETPWYTVDMIFDSAAFPIFEMELADTILRKVRHRKAT